jgi:hypothetical protein
MARSKTTPEYNKIWRENNQDRIKFNRIRYYEFGGLRMKLKPCQVASGGHHCWCSGEFGTCCMCGLYQYQLVDQVMECNDDGSEENLYQ